MIPILSKTVFGHVIGSRPAWSVSQSAINSQRELLAESLLTSVYQGIINVWFFEHLARFVFL